MRLLPSSDETTDKPASVRKADKKSGTADTGATSKAGRKSDRGIEKATEKDAPAATVPAVSTPLVDYTRPNTSTDLLMDLQQRVRRLEEAASKKLTAGEYAIVVEATTGTSLERWQKQGYVVEKCNCENLACKGWRMTPIEHKRTAGEDVPQDSSAVAVTELKDVVPEPTVDEEWDDDDLDAIFRQMFKDGLLTRNSKGETLIPPDGPINWTHGQMLAFAHGFEMGGLKLLRGKPRELQRHLIAALKGLGYDVLVRPDVTVAATSEGKTGGKKTKRKEGS
jgi:hypothetical protein